MIENPTLGQRVTFTAPLSRVTEPGEYDRETGTFRDAKVWRANPHVTGTFEGVIVGVRTLSDGVRSWGAEDEPITYKPREHFEALLIAEDLRTRPVYARPDTVTALEATT